jgi:signal transduction histidine kinase
MSAVNSKNIPPNARPPRNMSSFYSAWKRRPLSGLRWQLTFVSSLFLITAIILTIWITDSVASPASASPFLPEIKFVALALIVAGVVLLFFVINFLLRPLRRTTEVAQAITLGDLQQRARLLPLLEGRDEVSALAASLSIMVDQLEQSRQTQQSAEQRFRRLFSDASHQLRTPLTSLRGFTEILTRGVASEDPATTQRILKMMKNEAERMTFLVNDLLMLARLDDGESVEKQFVDLADLALESVAQARLKASDGRMVSVQFATHERLGVQANPDRLKQALAVLFDNAMKYGSPAPDGWIKLNVDQDGSYALLQVRNNGKGIHPDDLPRIFERFYRGEHMPGYDSGKAPPSGTGLGLPIALAIVHDHDGELSASSTPDVETTFTLKLPRSRQQGRNMPA